MGFPQDRRSNGGNINPEKQRAKDNGEEPPFMKSLSQTLADNSTGDKNQVMGGGYSQSQNQVSGSTSSPLI